MHKSPFITILTASLNRGTTIEATLQSIRDQHFANLEHIVIDGGSNDKTIQILRRFEKKYNLIWKSEPDYGIAEALNKGFKNARGKYILAIQSDDRLRNSDVLKRIFPILLDEKIDIHSFPVVKEFATGNRLLLRPIPLLWWNRFKFIFPHQGTFVHRRVFERIGEFDISYSIAMDYHFFYRAILSGCSVKFHKAPPVALMGGEGIGTRAEFLSQRLTEEFRIHQTIEADPFWRLAQRIFEKLYLPYKMRLIKR